jgi:hypothetical protein
MKDQDELSNSIALNALTVVQKDKVLQSKTIIAYTIPHAWLQSARI